MLEPEDAVAESEIVELADGESLRCESDSGRTVELIVRADDGARYEIRYSSPEERDWVQATNDAHTAARILNDVLLVYDLAEVLPPVVEGAPHLQ
jgi:hypothetical protein